MIRACCLILAGALTSSAQVRQGGAYQIQSETLDPGGGASSGGSYALRQSLFSLGAMAQGGAYAVWSGFTGQLVGGSGPGPGSGAAAFALWQTVLFGGPSEPHAGPNEDPDLDGIPNLLEFAFNLPPLVSSVLFAEPGATGGLPLIREESFGADRYFTMEFIRRKNAGQFSPETSRALAAWSPATFTVLSGPDSVTPVYERMKLRLGVPILPGGKIYYRLSVLIR